MARKPRVEYKGAVYHVIHRGNNREYIFEDAADKRYLLSSIVDIKDPMGLSLMGYVIMSNHYHLLVKTEKRALSVVMQKLNNDYARYYNKKIGRSGHVFGDRYKSTLITDNNYLISVLRYIHLNPVKAEMTENSHDYKWSSDMHYRRNNNRFVDIDFVLDIMNHAHILIKEGKEELGTAMKRRYSGPGHKLFIQGVEDASIKSCQALNILSYCNYKHLPVKYSREVFLFLFLLAAILIQIYS